VDGEALRQLPLLVVGDRGAEAPGVVEHHAEDATIDGRSPKSDDDDEADDRLWVHL
jgi:hypothetical protein